ncbi:hypothetical protein HY570_01355 [Candidatus Micrarchaeota archaeon]|nr:hypothetical protein [Candidatus Micrarchaeota archaeon]
MSRYQRHSVKKIYAEDLSWESLINVFEEDLNESLKGIIQLQSRDNEGVPIKLHKELAITRLILSERLKHADKEQVTPDSKLLVDLVKLLKRCEKLSTLYELNLDKWSSFILAIIEKLKKEKLLVYKSKKPKEKLIWQKIKRDLDEKDGKD